MKKQITRISLIQTSKVVALCYFSLVIIALPIGIGFLLFGGNDRSTGFALCVIPVVYAILAFVMSLIAGAIYNFVAKRFGGIEFTVSELPDQTP